MGPRSCIGPNSTMLMDYHLVQIRTTSPIWDPTTQHNGFLAPHAEAQFGCRIMIHTSICLFIWKKIQRTMKENIHNRLDRWFTRLQTIWKELKIIFKLTSYFLSVFRIQIQIRIPYSGNTDTNYSFTNYDTIKKEKKYILKVDHFIIMLNSV